MTTRLGKIQTCLICFEELPLFEKTAAGVGRLAAIKCIDRNCAAIVCNDCMTGYIAASSAEIPKCPGTKCGTTIPLSKIGHLDRETVSKYCELALKELSMTESAVLNKKAAAAQIITSLRAERLKFVKASFPAAVAHVATTFMNNKFVKMEKDLAKKMERQVADVNKYCFNLACDGRLDANFKCLKCDERFCEKCERPKPDSSHQCKQQDVESVAAVNASSKCPKCKTVVFKDIGCNHIHCIKCGTHFDYVTGETYGDEITDWGEQPANSQVQWDPAKKLALVYKDRLTPPAFDALFKFESNRPAIPGMETVHRAIQGIAGGGSVPLRGSAGGGSVLDKARQAQKVAQTLDKIITSKYKFKDHISKLNQIEKVILAASPSDPLTETDLGF